MGDASVDYKHTLYTPAYCFNAAVNLWYHTSGNNTVTNQLRSLGDIYNGNKRGRIVFVPEDRLYPS